MSRPHISALWIGLLRTHEQSLIATTLATADARVMSTTRDNCW